MAISYLLDGVLNDSLTYQMLVRNLIAKSAFLPNIDGIVNGTFSMGKVVKNALMTQPTANDWDGKTDITLADADDTPKSVTVNQGAEFSSVLYDTDIDASFWTAESLQSKIAELGGAALQTKVDTYVASQLAAGAGTTGTAVLALASTNVDAFLEEGIEILLRKNVSESDIDVYVPSWAWTAIQNAGGVVTETAQGAFSAGKVLNYMGARIILSNNLKGTDAVTAKEAIFTPSWSSQYVIGGTKIESTRKEANFADILKGYTVYGAGVLQADAVVKTIITKA